VGAWSSLKRFQKVSRATLLTPAFDITPVQQDLDGGAPCGVGEVGGFKDIGLGGTLGVTDQGFQDGGQGLF
jgi:hypothetical protein